jgi:hypothetical protein
MGGYGTSASGAKRPFAVAIGFAVAVDATHLQHDELKLLTLLIQKAAS